MGKRCEHVERRRRKGLILIDLNNQEIISTTVAVMSERVNVTDLLYGTQGRKMLAGLRGYLSVAPAAATEYYIYIDR